MFSLTDNNISVRLILQLNQSETNAIEMYHLSIEDRGGVIGHQKACVSVAHIIKICLFISLKSQFTRFSIISTTMRALSNVSVAQVGIGRRLLKMELIVRQHEFDRFRSPSDTSIVNVCNRRVRGLSEIFLIQLYYQTNHFFKCNVKFDLQLNVVEFCL